MKRREEADSGLRAGFVHEDDLKQIKHNAPASDNIETAKDGAKAKELEKVKAQALAAAEAKSEKTEAELADAPTVSVQGVSGKMITGVIKAVKKKSESPAETETDNKPEKSKSDKASSTVEKVTEEAEPQKVPVAQTKVTPETTEAPKSVAVESQKKETAASKETQQAAESKATTVERGDGTGDKSVEPQETTQKDTPADAKPAAKKVREVPQTQEKSKPQAATQEKTASRKSEIQSEQTKPKRATTPDKPQKPRVKEDQGVILSAAERLERAGKTIIRPQSGNYVGRGADRTRHQKYGGRQKGFSDRGRRRGGRPRGGRQEGFFDKDKDADEQPRRSRSPRPRKRSTIMPDNSVINSQKDASRRNFRERSQRDKNRDDHWSAGWRGQEELDLNEEIARRGRRRRAKAKAQRASQAKSQLTEVVLPSSLTVKELAEIIKKTSAEVITKLIGYGVMATVNQEIDFDTAAIIASEFGIKAEQKEEVSEEDILFDDSEDKDEDLKPRPPVVVVMGHVDHGKTSILDWIRSSRVVSGEAGGITQHIGAYMVDVNDRKITFLDTPGHEAFTMIRQRGAQITDIAVLVVAADDGVMPQTIEAINHAKAADTEIIVAINKIDKPTANIERVKQELAQHGIMDADWGGQNTIVPVSAKTGENMDELLEMILLTAAVMELKANPDRQAKGTVVEASLDKNRGALATLLVQRGTLHRGDAIVVGTMMGNVRAMFDDRHQPIEAAGPSVPVEIMGLPDVPEAGDIFYEVENEKVAKSLVERRKAEEREEALKATNKLSLENLFEQMGDGETKDLNIIVKADVQGSAQAMSSSLEKLSNDEVRVHIIHSAVGAVTASDVRLADVSDAIIIGFNVRPPASVSDMAKEANVQIRLYRVIYEALDDVEKAMKGLLDPVFEEGTLGRAEVRETFKASGVGTIAGCYVTNGLIRRNANIRLIRDGVVMHEGKLASLRRFQDDVREVQQGYECGLSIDRFNDIKVGDEIECYQMVELER